MMTAQRADGGGGSRAMGLPGSPARVALNSGPV